MGHFVNHAEKHSYQSFYQSFYQRVSAYKVIPSCKYSLTVLDNLLLLVTLCSHSLALYICCMYFSLYVISSFVMNTFQIRL